MQANTTVAGAAYTVNASATVNITPGQTYTLSFDVSGAAGRTMLAGIGLSAVAQSC